MPKKASKAQTPAQIMVDIIKCGMTMRGETQASIAKKMHAHRNTVTYDLDCPERIPQERLWLYFALLDIPVDEVLQVVAGRLCDELTKRSD